MRNLKQIAGKVLKVLPDEGLAVKQAIRGLMVQKDLAAIKLNSLVSGERLPDPRTIFWIDPFRIEFRTSLSSGSPDSEDWVFSQMEHVKLIQGGDWDQTDLRVANLRICRAVEDRIQHQLSWQQSDYYKTAIRQIEAGRVLWGCADRPAFDKRMEEIDRLIEGITRSGYRQQEVGSLEVSPDSLLGHTEVLINLGRNGESLFQDGRHRLAIARALGIRSIPVQVYIRHSEWQSFREFMHRMASGSGGAAKPGFLYQKPHHFDFDDIPAEHGCTDRWNAILPHLQNKNGGALDIGANLGYFSHELDRAGFTTTAVEYLPEVARAAVRLAVAEKRNIKIVHGDVLAPSTLAKLGSSNFAVVLAINIFHHFIKTEEGYLRLRAFMEKIRSDVMFFEPHHPDDPQMQDGFMNPTPEEFTTMIVSWGGFSNHTPIYEAEDGRMIFKLT